MRHLFLASTCLFALAGTAHAETTIAAKQTAAARTSTIKQGAADDIRITSAGSVELTTGGAAVTADSANKITNEGLIQISNANDATGILAQAGTSGGISNSGKITVDATLTPADTDNDGDADGPFAIGSNRVGIATAGAYSGTIANSGTISVLGNDSAGIKLGGALTGDLRHDGATSVTGDRAVGIQTGDVSGAIRLAGTVDARGVDAVAARIGGNVGGTLTVQGTITSTGYRYTAAPTDPSKLDADDLLQGGTALVVEGNVAGGIILAIPPKDVSATDPDEDKDGIEDAKEGTAVVRSFGAAPAIRIGAADHDITIGAVPNTTSGFGLIIDGVVQGNGVYANVAARGIQIGDQGGKVTIAGGIGINGSVSASASGASATALRLGAGATTPLIQVGGKIEATGSNALATVAAAIVVDQNASVATIRNSGTIKATATGENGSAIGIIDFSGTVKTVENSGTISATGAKADSGRNVAIDLSDTIGGTVKQTAVAAGFTAPSITGNILFGAGNDLLDVADGNVKGDTYFGAGADTLNLSGDAVYEGNVSFGTGGATMALAGTSIFKGTADFGDAAGTLGIGSGATFGGSLAHAGNVAVNLSGGTLALSSSAQISSLAVTNKGMIAVTLGQAGNTTPLIAVSGAASFAADSKLSLKISDVTKAVGNHLILTAGTLSGASNLSTDTTLVPFLYKASLTTGTNSLTVSVDRKSRSELGLNRSEGSAFDAAYAALAKDSKVAGAFLSLTSQDSFRATLRQMLPDHAGGTFSALTQGSRTFARILEDPRGPFKDEGNWGYWISQVGWGQSKAIDATSGFDVTGWGFGGGVEYKTGKVGNVGVSAAYLWSRNSDQGTSNEVRANQYELAAYWRLRSGRLLANARGAVSFIDLGSSRDFQGTDGTTKVSLNAHADHGARLYSGSGSVGYEMGSGALSFRPVLAADYYRLSEKGYTETGGGSAFNLIVASRKSDELALTASGVVGLNWGGEDQFAGWSRLEIEGGRREIVSGKLGATVARFGDGAAFTLTPADRQSGWVGRLRGVAGNANFRVGGEFSAEQQQGALAIGLRASLRVGL